MTSDVILAVCAILTIMMALLSGLGWWALFTLKLWISAQISSLKVWLKEWIAKEFSMRDKASIANREAIQNISHRLSVLEKATKYNGKHL